MKYRVVIIWSTGEKNVVIASDEFHANKIEQAYRMAFGRQIEYIYSQKITHEEVTNNG